MGLSIHYSATIRHISLVEKLIEETTDICKSMQWEYHIIREPGDKGINGIVFSPENCEPVFLTFLSNGRMCSPISLQYKDSYAANGLDPELIYTTSTKTQYAGPATHIALLRFMKYLKGKYFENFEMDDEGFYWHTNNEKILAERFDHYNYLLNTVSEALTNIPHQPGETTGSLADRIEEILKKKFGNEDGAD